MKTFSINKGGANMFLKRFIAVIAVLFSVFTLSYALDLKGTTESSSIDSKILGHAFKYKVYLPAEYTSQKQFPVIYLLHGSNGNENSWDELLGTLDTLISCGEIPPFAAVVPCSGYSWWIDGREKYESAFINELMPLVEKKYNFSQYRETRIISGFSMGGYGALRYALVYPELFSGAILLSPALYDTLPPIDSSARETGNFGMPFDIVKWNTLNYPQALKKYRQQSSTVSLFIAAGDDDWHNPEGFEFNIEQQAVRAYGILCKENKIPGELRILNGGHDSGVWKPAFSEGLKYLGSIVSKEIKKLSSSPAIKTEVKIDKVWSFKAAGAINSSPAVGNDGTIYFGCDGKKIYALTPDGNKKWEYATDDAVYATPAIDNDGTVYFACWDGFLYAMNPDGTLKWKNNTGCGDSSPCIGVDGSIYIGSSDGKLICIDKNSTIKWQVQLGSIVTSSPITDTRMIFVASEDNKFFAFSLDGQKIWQAELDSWITSSPSFYDENIVMAVSGSSLYVFEKSTGKVIKQIAVSGGRSSAVTDKNGNIYIGTREDKKLYAFNKNFEKIWDFATGARVYSTPLTVSGGLIMFGSRDKSFYCVDSFGNMIYELKTGGEVNSSPVMAEDGTLYIGSADSQLYAIRFTDTSFQESLWPMFRGNKRRNGSTK